MPEIVTVSSPVTFASGDGQTTSFQMNSNGSIVTVPVNPVFYEDGELLASGSYTVAPMGIVQFAIAPAQGVVLAWSGQYLNFTSGTFDTPGPLSTIIRAYLYQQYFDDADLVSFVQVLNQKMQGYLNWFNNTALGVYTSGSISGALLDWIGTGLYGISRPVISSFTETLEGAWNTDAPYNEGTAWNGLIVNASGSVAVASDDIYKRVLTWYQYAADGRQASIMWLRRRVARFIYGVNGADVPTDALATISIAPTTTLPAGAFGSAAYNGEPPYNDVDSDFDTVKLARALTITVPDLPVSGVFAALVAGGILALPFQMSFSVAILD